MATKALKGVSEDKWAEFKAIAANRDVSMGELFNEAVDALAKEKSKSQWERILANRVEHTPKEWAAIEKKVKDFRKDFELREFK